MIESGLRRLQALSTNLKRLQAIGRVPSISSLDSSGGGQSDPQGDNNHMVVPSPSISSPRYGFPDGPSPNRCGPPRPVRTARVLGDKKPHQNCNGDAMVAEVKPTPYAGLDKAGDAVVRQAMDLENVVRSMRATLLLVCRGRLNDRQIG